MTNVLIIARDFHMYFSFTVCMFYDTINIYLGKIHYRYKQSLKRNKTIAAMETIKTIGYNMSF